MKVAIITCSTRSASGARADRSGQLLTIGFGDAGHVVTQYEVVPDDVEAIQMAINRAIVAGVAVIVTTGGTGLAATDVTPEAVSPLLDRELPGIAEALRAVARQRVPTSILSRGVAGVIGSVIVVTLPGSPGAVQDGLEVLLPVLGHAVDQIAGADH